MFLKILWKGIQFTDTAHHRRIRSSDYETENKRWDPLTAGASSVVGTITNFTSAFGGMFIDPYKEVKRVRAAGGQGSSASLAAAMSVGKGMGGMTAAATKGALVDFPLAMAEGLRQAPALLGDEVRDHGPVKDWKSGGVVAAKVCQRQPLGFLFSM